MALRRALAAAAAAAAAVPVAAEASPDVSAQAEVLHLWAAAAEAAHVVPPSLLSCALPVETLSATGAGGPQILPQWSADIEYDGTLGGMRFKNGSGTFLYDRDAKRQRTTYTCVTDFFRLDHLNKLDTLVGALPGGLGWQNSTFGGIDEDDAVCTPMPNFGRDRTYRDSFFWLPFAAPRGSRVVHGERCDLFVFSIAKPISADFAICIGQDGLPRELNQSSSMTTYGFYSNMRFSNFRVGAPADSEFRVSRACAEHFPRPACEDSGVVALDVYRIFGPPEPPVLVNRNAGDIFGDLAFICTQGADAAYAGKKIAHYKVNVSRAFGQYAVCSFDGVENRCVGPEAMLRSVGRRSGQFQGVGPSQGQCSSNDDVGSQFSFPAQAKCPPGVAPAGVDGGSCAWAEPVALRTVDAACVMHERGLLDACAREVGHAPFTQSAAIFAAALASSDPAVGGCPDAGAGVSSGAASIIL